MGLHALPVLENMRTKWVGYVSPYVNQQKSEVNKASKPMSCIGKGNTLTVICEKYEENRSAPEKCP